MKHKQLKSESLRVWLTMMVKSMFLVLMKIQKWLSELVLAYADKDTDAMYEMMADTVRFAPPSGGMLVNSR